MEKLELFKTALSNTHELVEFDQEELLKIGSFLGHNTSVFKEIYQAYLQERENFENNPMFGAKIEIEFDWDNKSVTINQLETKLEFTMDQLLKYFSLIDICFETVHPIGSVVEIDLEMMNNDFRKMYTDTEPLAVITGRKVALNDDYFADYFARPWPFGEGSPIQPMFLSNVLIKRVVFTGMIDETEEEFVNTVLRTDVINSKRKSAIYISEDESKELANVAERLVV